MIVLEAEVSGGTAKRRLCVRILKDKTRPDDPFQRRVVHNFDSEKLLEALVGLEGTNRCLRDLVQTAIFLGMSAERAKPGKYFIPDDK